MRGQPNELEIARQVAREERITRIKLQDKVTNSDLGFIYKIPLHQIRTILDNAGIAGKKGSYPTTESIKALDEKLN